MRSYRRFVGSVVLIGTLAFSNNVFAQSPTPIGDTVARHIVANGLAQAGAARRTRDVRGSVRAGVVVGGLTGAAGGGIAGMLAGEGHRDAIRGAWMFGTVGVMSGAMTGFTVSKTPCRLVPVLAGILVNAAVWTVAGAVIGSRTDNTEGGAKLLARWGVMHGAGTAVIVSLR